MNSNLTLRQRYESTKQATSPTPKSEFSRPVDPLQKWLGKNVVITFMSGRMLEGTLSEIYRFDITVTDSDGVVSHCPKHAIERMWQR
jgi:hypothetical protein